MEFDRNRRPQYGRYSRNDDRDNGDRQDRGDRGGRGGFQGGDHGNRGGYRGGGGGFREKRDFEPTQRDEAVFSEKVRAGKRRTYFFDVRQTRGEDYFITITESTRRSDGYGHTRHKIFLYKEDFNRFSGALDTVINKVKVDLNPDFDYEEFDRRQAEWEAANLDEEGNYIGGDNTDSKDTVESKPVKRATSSADDSDDDAEEGSGEITSEEDMAW